jgi:hypothetical protein
VSEAFVARPAAVRANGALRALVLVRNARVGG